MATTLNSKSNESPFQGWMEAGNYRAEWQSFGAWEIFQKDGDAFVRIGQSRGKKTDTLEDLVAGLIDSEDFDHS